MKTRFHLLALAAGLLALSWQFVDAGNEYKFRSQLLANAAARQRARQEPMPPQAPASETIQPPEVDPELLHRAKLVGVAVEQGRNEETIELAKQVIDVLAKKVDEAQDPGQQHVFAQILLPVYMHKMRALHALNEHFDAMLHGLRMKTICSKYAATACTATQVDIIETTMQNLEHNIKMLDPAQAFGLTAKEARDQRKLHERRRRLRMLLHPDKNRYLSEAASRELNHIFSLADQVYEKLLAKIRN